MNTYPTNVNSAPPDWATSELIRMSVPLTIGPNDWDEMSPGVKSAILNDLSVFDLGPLNVIGVTYEDGRIATVTIDPNDPPRE